MFHPGIKQFALLFLFPLSAQNSVALTLQEAVISATQYDSGISAARNLNDAEQQKRLQGFSGLLPVISLNGGYSKQDQPNASYAAGVTRHYYSVNLTQPIFDIAKFATWKRASTIADLAQINFMIAQQKLIVDVSDAWFSVAYGAQVLSTARKEENAVEKQLKQAQTGLAIGEKTRLDVDEAQANYDKSQADVITAQSKLNNARIRFQKLTGFSGESVPEQALDCLAPVVNTDLATLQTRAAQGNLDIQAALLNLDKSQADVISSTGNHLPVVTLQIAYGNNWSRAEDGNVLDTLFGTTSKTRNTNIGVNVSIPIFAGGSQISQSIEAAHRKEQAKDLLTDARRNTQQNTESAWANLRAGAAKIKAYSRAIISARQRLKSTQYGQDLGMRTSIDVLNAESDYFRALRDKAQAQYEYITAGIQLDRETGELDFTALRRFSCPTNR